MRIKIPERDPDFKLDNSSFWFEEMVEHLIVDKELSHCFELLYFNENLCYYNDILKEKSETYLIYSVEFQHTINKAYKEWLFNKELKKMLAEDGSPEEI